MTVETLKRSQAVCCGDHDEDQCAVFPIPRELRLRFRLLSQEECKMGDIVCSDTDRSNLQRIAAKIDKEMARLSGLRESHGSR
jgi:hypothetical protein